MDDLATLYQEIQQLKIDNELPESYESYECYDHPG